MDQHKYESEKILRTVLSKFVSLELEDGVNPDAFFEAENMSEEIERHGEKISTTAYKNAVIRAMLDCYSDLKFASYRDPSFSLEYIQSAMRNTYCSRTFPSRQMRVVSRWNSNRMIRSC